MFPPTSSQFCVLADSFVDRDPGLRGADHRLRVVGGRLSGRRFRAPQGGVRPTSDRVREALFGRLGNLEGVRVLDLYAGSGALGIEAISRGAVEATFVEREARTLVVLRANLAALEIDPIASVAPYVMPFLTPPPASQTVYPQGL